MNRMDTARRAAIVRCLIDGVGVRATCRITGASKGGVLRLISDLGPVCAEYMDAALRELPCSVLEVDETWWFVEMKEKRVLPARAHEWIGDVWTFTAICADTKLIPSFMLGTRDARTATEFLQDLAGRIHGRVQLTTDGHSMYLPAVEDSFAGRVDYAQLVKIYGAPEEPEKRYSPAVCTGVVCNVIQGDPDRDRISTSYVERANLSIRMGLRRFTRLTNAHSKKVANHAAALAIYFLHYNFARVHQTVRCSPAMAAGMTARLWTVEDLVRLLEIQERGEDFTAWRK